MLGIGILGDVELTLQSRDLHSENGFSARCLTGLEASLSAEATASNDNSVLKIANAYVTIGLTNFDADGLIADVNEEGSDFAKYFVSEVADSGIITGKGDLYDLHNGFQSDDREDPYYTLYGYDLRGLDEIPAGRNLYLGID